MSTFRIIWECMFTPRLIKLYGNGPLDKGYEPLNLERWGDKVINSLYIMWKFGVYTSPFLVGIMYRKGFFMPDGMWSLTKFVTSVGVILVISFGVRAIGRSWNSTYLQFARTLRDAQESLTPSNKQRMAKYDFEFFAWPVEFSYKDLEGDLSKHRIDISRPIPNLTNLQELLLVPYKIIGYIAIHTFGIRLIYPGSIGLLQMILEQGLRQGRAKLVETNKGIRYKLQTRDHNDVDTMFVDKRHLTPNGNTLVICCEGNAGFYEIGIMCTPIEAGYSVLGWNHPGFGGSTGIPYPDQEKNTIDIVMQFAIHKLGFKIENILLFGWSIGGYSASWAAMNYPDVKGVILDATFDDILPLAINQMPVWWESLVKFAIREHANLNNYEVLAKYSGPVLLIRRTEDEVIALRESDLTSNRGNHLLLKLLNHRYPLIFDEINAEVLANYLSVTAKAQDEMVAKQEVNSDVCRSLLASHISENSKSYPMNIGEGLSPKQKRQLALFLASKYMKDYKSAHCTPLPRDMFVKPWDIYVESDYVFT